MNILERNLYRIDHDDRIVSVDGAWDSFAISNDAPELVSSTVIDRNLWDFVTDDMTRHIYQQMLVHVRKGASLDFAFRCDSPDRRRFLEMHLTPLSNDGVQFETCTNHVEERSSQDIYRRPVEFTDELVITCSWCKKMKTAENIWQEVEQAVQVLQLFNFNPTPRLSHGMCQACYDTMTAKLKKTRREG